MSWRRAPTAKDRVATLVGRLAKGHDHESVWARIEVDLQRVYDEECAVPGRLLPEAKKRLEDLSRQMGKAQQQLAASEASFQDMTAKIENIRRVIGDREERISSEEAKLKGLRERLAILDHKLGTVGSDRKRVEYDILTVTHSNSAPQPRLARVLITLSTVLGALLAIWLILHKKG